MYVVVSTFNSLRNEQNSKPENLLLVIGIAVTSAFLMYSSLLFGAIFYCKQRRAFAEADKAVEVHGQFSDAGNKKRSHRRPGKSREYTSRSAL